MVQFCLEVSKVAEAILHYCAIVLNAASLPYREEDFCPPLEDLFLTGRGMGDGLSLLGLASQNKDYSSFR